MALITGRNGLAYINSLGTLVLLKATRFTLKTDVQLYRNDNFDGLWGNWLPLPMTWSGSIEGLLDTSDSSPFYAITGGHTQNPQPGFTNMQLYPNAANAGRFYAGFIWPHITIDQSRTGAVRYILEFQGEGALQEN